jgi:hypothetical protein
MSTEIEAALNRFELGWPEEALALLDQVQAQNPAARQALALEQARIFLALRRADEAVQALSPFTGPDAQLEYLRGLAYRQLGRWPQAVAVFESADQLAADDPAVLANLGWCLHQQGQRNRGRAILERAQRLDLGRLPTALDLALLYADLGRYQAAAACAQRAYFISAGSPLAQEILEWVTELRASRGGTKPRRPAPPRTDRDWRQLISAAEKPLDLIQLAVDRFKPQTERELNQLAERMIAWWNTTPLPELGGLSPDQVLRQEVRSSQVEIPPPPPWLALDPAVAAANHLRQNMAAYLTQLQQGKYTATSALGNLPLKALYAINERLVKPVELETQIGEKTYKPRSSEHIWLFDFMRALALTGELASFEPGRRILLLEAGQAYLESAPRRQLWLLFSTWWEQTNWLYVYPWQTFEEEVMQILPRLARDLLLALAPGKWAPIEGFLSALIAAGSLQDFSATSNQNVLRYGLEKMVLQVLAEFDGMEFKIQPKEIGSMQFATPVEFRLTPFGRELLSEV